MKSIACCASKHLDPTCLAAETSVLGFSVKERWRSSEAYSERYSISADAFFHHDLIHTIVLHRGQDHSEMPRILTFNSTEQQRTQWVSERNVLNAVLQCLHVAMLSADSIFGRSTT